MHIDEVRKYHREKEHLMRNEGTHPANSQDKMISGDFYSGKYGHQTPAEHKMSNEQEMADDEFLAMERRKAREGK